METKVNTQTKLKSNLRKKVKYTALNLRIPLADKKVYMAYCKSEGLSLKRLTKNILREYMKTHLCKNDFSPNQLDLFASPSQVECTQLSIF
ncbi:MAG: hypothetical protein RRY15_04100 [Bacteroidales bacterium]